MNTLLRHNVDVVLVLVGLALFSFHREIREWYFDRQFFGPEKRRIDTVTRHATRKHGGKP